MPTGPEIADVSVIMPAWRSAATIERALRSVAKQTVLPREVIVVDDGSEDGTFDAAAAMTTELQPVSLRVFRQPNAGPGSARNRAISESSSRLLAFLDADDEWLPEKLAKSLDAFEDQKTVLVAHNILEKRDGDEQEVDCSRHLPERSDAFVALFKRGFVATTSVVCRRHALEGAGGFDETLLSGQDYELWLAIAKSYPGGLVVMSAPLSRYHRIAGSVSSNIELRRRCSLRIARRHMLGLFGRTAHPVSVLVFRLSVIAAEAVIGQLRRGSFASAATGLIALPLGIVVNTARMAFRAAPQDTAVRMKSRCTL